MHLEGHFTLSHVESELLRLKVIKKCVNFFAPDGTIYSKGSAVEDVMQFSSFRLRVDEQMDYNVHY